MEVKHNGRSLLHENDEAFMEWLEAQEGRYQTKCRDAFLMFLDFLREKEGFEDPTGDKILSQHQANQRSGDMKVKHYFADLMPKFHQWLKTEYVSPKTGRPLSHNSATSYIAPLRGFFAFHRESLELTTTQQAKIALVEVGKKYHIFRREELAEMVRVGDLEEKAAILLGACEGIRVGDFVSQLRRPIIEAYKDFGEFPLEFEVETEKKGVVAVCHVTEETYRALETYWETIPQSKYVFPSNSRHISNDHANDILKGTWLKAFPDRKDARIRFHELRSYKMSALSNAGINQWHIKRMVGKKVSPDILTYLEGIDLRADFMKAEEAFTFLGLAPSNHVVVGQLTQAYGDLEEKVSDLEGLIQALTKENVELREKLNESNEEATSELEEAKERLAESVNLMKDLGIGLSELLQQVFITANVKLDIERAEHTTKPLEDWKKAVEKLIKKLNE